MIPTKYRGRPTPGNPVRFLSRSQSIFDNAPGRQTRPNSVSQSREGALPYTCTHTGCVSTIELLKCISKDRIQIHYRISDRLSRGCFSQNQNFQRTNFTSHFPFASSRDVAALRPRRVSSDTACARSRKLRGHRFDVAALTDPRVNSSQVKGYTLRG